MTVDLNKGIKDIVYNHLNLPERIYIASSEQGEGNITYIYDATGVKLKKIVYNFSQETTNQTIYAGNYIYEDNGELSTLKFFNQPEGYVEPNGNGGFNYVYSYKDHLGNVRLSYSDSDNNGSIDASTEIISEKNYYPFGLKHKGYNNVINGTDHKYGFGGKEEQDELGLGWVDITARNYDPALGRWMNLDPLAEQMRRHSPYNYAFDNPIYFVDPDGMAPVDWIKMVDGEEKLVYDPKLNDGKGGFTEHATNMDKNLAKSLRGTVAGEAQFQKLVNSSAKIQTVVNSEDKPVDNDGNPILAEVSPRNSISATDFDGNIASVEVTSATINFYLENIDEVAAIAVDGDTETSTNLNGTKIPEGLNFSQIFGAIFGHEIEHTTDENALTAANGGDVEEKPTEISDKILEEENKN